MDGYDIRGVSGARSYLWMGSELMRLITTVGETYFDRHDNNERRSTWVIEVVGCQKPWTSLALIAPPDHSGHVTAVIDQDNLFRLRCMSSMSDKS